MIRLKLTSKEWEVLKHRIDMPDAIHSSLSDEDESITLERVQFALSDIIIESENTIMISLAAPSIHYRIAKDIFSSNNILDVCDLDNFVEGEEDYKHAKSLIAAASRINKRLEKLGVSNEFLIY